MAARAAETDSFSEHELSNHCTGAVRAFRPLPVSLGSYGPGNRPGSQKFPFPSLTVLVLAVFSVHGEGAGPAEVVGPAEAADPVGVGPVVAVLPLGVGPAAADGGLDGPPAGGGPEPGVS